MPSIRLGIVGTSDIAFKRFLPALKQSTLFEYIGIASRNIERTESFINAYGGRGFRNYDEIINSDETDAIYIPLPPALHFEWAKKALQRGKHVFLEKPFTTDYNHTKELIDIAKTKDLALHENYMFEYHSQLHTVQNMIKTGKIGRLRQIRCSFGFPKRLAEDFRYNEILGGGAFLDCGGYTVKLATILLGPTIRLVTSKLNTADEFDVDIFGSVTFENAEGITAQTAFGMDNSYKCELELWGSKGTIIASRIFTAPPDFSPELIYKTENESKIINLKKDDQFLNSINHFYDCTQYKAIREKAYREILKQSRLAEQIIRGER